jgi:hypothetical protein
MPAVKAGEVWVIDLGMAAKVRPALRFWTRCSAPREERIEAILAAWHELENCELSERARCRDQRNALLDQAIAGTRSCRQELLEALGPRFRDFKLARRKEREAKMAQLLHRP